MKCQSCKFLFIFLLLLLFIRTFSFAGEIPEICMMTVDGDGRWNQDLQKNISGSDNSRRLTKDGITVNLEPLKSAVAGGIKAKADLLKFPEALLSSKVAGKVFSCPYLLIISLEKNQDTWRASGRLYGIWAPSETHIGFAVDKDPAKCAEKILDNLPLSVAMIDEKSDFPVIAAGSAMFHKTGAGHITGAGEKRQYANPAGATKDRLKPCPICFYIQGKVIEDPVEEALGRELVRAVERAYTLSADSGLNDRVEKTGRRIISENRLNRYSYRFRVLDTNQVNAYAAPGGGIYITRGLLEILETDGELAGVLSHEITHCEKNHSLRMYEKTRTQSYVGTAIAIATGGGWMAGIADFAGKFLASGWSREFETEADRFAVIYASAAGFDSTEYVTALKKLRDYGKLHQESPGWFGTHPDDQKRIDESAGTADSLKIVNAVTEKFALSDPPLARHIRANPIGFIDEPGSLKKFVEACEKLQTEEKPKETFRLIPLNQAPGAAEKKASMEPPKSLKPDQLP